MKITSLIVALLFSIASVLSAQTLPQSRRVDWTLAGLRDTTTQAFAVIDMEIAGAINDGVTPNDTLLEDIILANTESGAILIFPAGEYLFNNPIKLSDNIIIKGESAENTTFVMDLGGEGHALRASGTTSLTDTTYLMFPATKDSSFLEVNNPSLFSINDWVQIIQLDTGLVTSSWAQNTVGQVVQISEILGNKIFLHSPLRIDFNLHLYPYIQKISPVKNIGIECVKIMRIDSTMPMLTSNIYFQYATNCWVSGIESENCTFSHIQVNKSSNISISKSYFHHGFVYGGNGRAYGVVLQSTAGECLVDDNIFEHLRHAMLLQSGANGNVFAYNYSRDPFWASFPSDASGDIVLHGNYPFCNLFESNICRNMVIDNSHGPNGMYNTFFRNRGEGFGIFFSSDTSPNQNLIGNEITNNSLPYNLVNYYIQGFGHFEYGNNDKGTIKPTGTEELPDTSYAYITKPDFIPVEQWAKIGTPNIVGTGEIPAYTRYQSENIFSNSCTDTTGSVSITTHRKETFEIYPNPVSHTLTIESSTMQQKDISLYTLRGRLIKRLSTYNTTISLDISMLQNGIYFVNVNNQYAKVIVSHF